jgi:hypothetical protein
MIEKTILRILGSRTFSRSQGQIEKHQHEQMSSALLPRTDVGLAGRTSNVMEHPYGHGDSPGMDGEGEQSFGLGPHPIYPTRIHDR